MKRVVCGIVGHSGVGKTQLIAQIVPILHAAGRRVAYVKHAHDGFDLDRPATDSARVRAAGVDHVVLTGPDGAAMLDTRPERTLADALAAIGAADAVLVEGFSHGAHPKIRVHDERDDPPREVAAPVVLELQRRGDRWPDADVARAAAVVLDLGSPAPAPALQVHVVADGLEVPVSGFAAEAVARGLLGITSALRGVDTPTSLTVTVTRSEGSGELEAT